MSLILMATALSGVLTTRLLLFFDVRSIMIRYPLAVLAAYLAFFCFIKLWLKYLAAAQPLKALDGAADALDGATDLLPDLSGFSGSGSGGGTTIFRGSGGLSGGSGASASLDGPLPNSAVLLPDASGSSGGAAGGIFEKAGNGLAGLFDDDGIVLLALGLLLAATVGGAIYLVYLAPHILSEAAFDFLLGAGLIRSYRRMNQPDWMGSVFRDTWKPFLIVLAVAFCAAWMIHRHDPSITKLSDLF